MSEGLLGFVQAELARPTRPAASAAARALAGRSEQALAVLFYGSVLRTGDPDGVMDFYVLTAAPPRGLRGLASRSLWPDVSYREIDLDEGRVRAKVAAMTLAQFARAAAGGGADTTIWTRFVQPAALAWSATPDSAAAAAAAVAEAARTAARLAAALGPAQGPAGAYWGALFRQTYAAELRMEPAARGQSILAFDPARYDALLPLAWRAADVAFDAAADGTLSPRMTAAQRRRIVRAWRLRRALGRPLNAARLVKAAFTFEGAARYAAWKIERHTGVAVPLTPWRERHPILAAPGVLWRLSRARRSPQDRAR